LNGREVVSRPFFKYPPAAPGCENAVTLKKPDSPGFARSLVAKHREMRRITASNELSRLNARKGTEMNKNELVAAVAEKSASARVTQLRLSKQF
jgi:hypothetical protein